MIGREAYIDESSTVFVVEEDAFWLTLLGEVPFLVRRALKNWEIIESPGSLGFTAAPAVT